MRDGFFHLLGHVRVALHVSDHVRTLRRREVALLVFEVALVVRRHDGVAHASFVAANVLADFFALLDLGADVRVGDVVAILRVMQLVGLAIGVGDDGWLAIFLALLVQMTNRVA